MEGVFQSTPPHGRRPLSWQRLNCTTDVSIHASAREATAAGRIQVLTSCVSIHASAREATPASAIAAAVERAFQYTPPHGRRRAGRQDAAGVAGVSIHASAREATTLRAAPRRFSLTFQSTPPHGRRHPVVRHIADVAAVSIHASAREATRDRVGRVERRRVSIHASAREATGQRRRVGVAGDVSIHASAREATFCWAASMSDIGFQSTPPHGRRLPTRRSPPQRSSFNPRLRTGGDCR